MEAFVFVRCVPGKTREVVRHMAAGKKTFDIMGMKEVFRTSGEWDAVAVVEADDLQGILDLRDKISDFRDQDQLVSQTSVVLRMPKQLGDP